jgi:signal peptidase II
MKKFLRPSLLVLGILLADQTLKTWVKTHMFIGQEIKVLGNWFIIHFIENNGMAFGIEFAGDYGKLFLTLFRLCLALALILFIRYSILNRYRKGFITCLCLILGGALGNIIDSAFYGKIYQYAPFLHGRVVDMLYFPIIQTHLPAWFPGIGGQEFVFFSPVFNLADASVSTGVISFLVFQKRYFKNSQPITQQRDTHSEILEV